MKAANILSSGGAAFLTASVSSVDVFPTAGVPTVSEKSKLSEQAAIDSDIARIHAEEELKLMIKGLDRSNEVIAKHLSEYEQAKADLSVGEKIVLIRAYQFFVDMLKQFDREDLHQLWILVKETFSIKQSTRDKEKELWVELKSEAWDRFKDLLRACPYHGFSELHQLDTFYNALNSKDQDSLNSDDGGNFLDKMPCECLAIIESKSKVRYSRNKPVVAKVSTNTSTSGVSPDVTELKDMVKALLLDKKSQN
nr:reverse transcriptase domain-containing protein [Tanacetum cinerariifolium]